MIHILIQRQDGSYFNEATNKIVTKDELRLLKHKPGFFIGWDKEVEALILDQELSNQAFRVFCYLVTNMNPQNSMIMQQSELCDKLNIAKSSICKYFKQFKDKKLIIEMGKFGNNKHYVVNPYIVFKGDAEQKKWLLRRISKKGINLHTS